jgi:hypothetical protein
MVISGASGVRRTRVDLDAGFFLLGAAALGFRAAFVRTGFAGFGGRLATFGAWRAGARFGGRFASLVGAATLEACVILLRRSWTLRSFFSSFLRLFSNLALFLSILLSRLLDATASSHPDESSPFGQSPP